MQKIWHNLNLDLADGGSQGAIYVRADDAGTQVLSIQLRTNGRAYKLDEDVVATLHGTRRDGTTLYNACCIEDNCIRMELKSELLGVAGRVACVVKLVGTEPAALTTPGFDIYVESVPEDGKIEAADSFGALVQQTAETKALQMEIEQKLADGEFDGEDGYSPEVTVTPIEDGYRLDVQNKDTNYSVDIIAPEKGEQGVGIASAVLNADYTLTLNFTDGSKYTTPSIRGAKGDKGDKGDKPVKGTDYFDGEDGVSPKVSVVQITNGHRVTIEDAYGTKSFDVLNGSKGNPGVTPAFSIGTVTTLEAGSQATASIAGTAEKPVLNLGIPKGKDGKDGENAEGGSGGTTDHAALINRDAANQHPISAIEGLEEALAGIPDKLADLNGDANHRVVTDAQIDAWDAKSEFSGDYNDLKNQPTIPTVPVQSVNGKTGAVVLDADDVGARADDWMPTAAQVGARPNTWMPTAEEVGAHPDTWMPTPQQVGADPAGTATSAVSSHNTSTAAHNDLRLLISELTTKVTKFLDVDDTSRDQLSELLALIDANAETLKDITTGKVNVADIINNLTTNVSNKPLSAAQGVALKALIDAIKVPTKVSELSNDANYAKKSELPTVPTKVSELDNDEGYLTEVPSEYVTDDELEAKGYLTEHQDISGKLDADKLPEAIDDALAQAKASGEFDGEDGYTPVKGKDYFDGQDGVDGVDGYTPVKGKDYYTDADKAEFETYIATELAKRGQLEPLYADSIEECTDTTKLYVLPDGMIYAYMLMEIEGGEPLFNNLIDPTSSDWQTDKRFSSSSGSISSCTGTIVSNVISMKKGDTIRVKGLQDGSTSATSSAYVGLMGYSDAAGTTKLWSTPMLFNKTKSQNSGGVKDLTTFEEGAYTYTGFPVIGGDGSVVERDGSASVVCVRVSGEPVTTVDDIIVTVNEEIKYSSAATGYAWASTGHAFVPADYEPRIIAVEERAFSNTERIISLEKAVENGGSGDATETAALAKIKNWDKPVYDSAPLTLISDDRAKPALPNSEKTVAAVYAKYRALMAKYPEYITETNLGSSSSSDTFAAVDMLRFDFKEPDGRVETGYALYETKPKIIFMTGVHNEYAGIYGLYYALEEIAENPDFKDIRRNAHIIVIPCANPFCLTSQTAVEGWTMSHVNANGVAIHNNFGVEFNTTNASATLGEYNYGGTEPYSEPETQHIDKVMRENSDAIAFVSCHNFNYGVKFAADFVWMSSATAHMCNLCFRLIDKLTTAWMDKYGDTYKTNFDAYRYEGTEPYADGDYRIGRACFSTSAGTEARNATKYGILGTNLEIGDRIRVISGNTTYTSDTMTRGAEVYANFIRTLLWNYDHKDKKEYAPNLPWSE